MIIKYEAHTDIDLRYVGGEGYAYPAVARIVQIGDVRSVAYLMEYRHKWTARLAAWMLNILMRWEVAEGHDYKLKPQKVTAADMEWATKQAEGLDLDSER